MKTLFCFLILVMFELPTSGQVKDGGRVILQEVILDSLNAPQAKLKDKCKEWIGKSFTKAKDVITSETEGSLIVRYNNNVKYSTGADFFFAHTMSIDIKQDKVRVRISVDRSENGHDASLFFFPEGKKNKPIWREWLLALNLDAKNMRESLTQSLTATDDW